MSSPVTDADNVAVLNESLDSAAQEAHHLLLVFKKHIAFEFEKEMLKVPLNSPELVSQRNLVLDAMMAQWNIIRALCFLLAENTGPETLLVELESQMQVIDGIFDTLRRKKSPFKEHEYVFPFNVLKLLTLVKNGVKTYLSSISVNSSTIAAIDKVAIPSNRAVVGVVGSAKPKHDTQLHPVSIPNQIATSTPAAHSSTPLSYSQKSGPVPATSVNVKDAKKLFESIENQISIDAKKMKQRPAPSNARTQIPRQEIKDPNPPEVRQKVVETDLLEQLARRKTTIDHQIESLNSSLMKKNTLKEAESKKISQVEFNEQQLPQSSREKISPVNPDLSATQEYDTVVASYRLSRKNRNISCEDMNTSNRSLSQSRTSSRTNTASRSQDLGSQQDSMPDARLNRNISAEKSYYFDQEDKKQYSLTKSASQKSIKSSLIHVETLLADDVPALSTAPDTSMTISLPNYLDTELVTTNVLQEHEKQHDVANLGVPDDTTLSHPSLKKNEVVGHEDQLNYPESQLEVSIENGHVKLPSDDSDRNDQIISVTELKNIGTNVSESSSPSREQARKGSVFSGCNDLTEIEKVLSNKFADLKNQISVSRNFPVGEPMHVSVPPPPVMAIAQAPIFAPHPPELPADQTVARSNLFFEQAAKDNYNDGPILATLSEIPLPKAPAPRPASRLISLRSEIVGDPRVTNRASRMMTNRLSTLADLKNINSQIAARHESIRQSIQLNKEENLLETIMSTYSKLDSDLLKQAAEVSAPPIISAIEPEIEEEKAAVLPIHEIQESSEDQQEDVFLEQKTHLPSENNGRTTFSMAGGMKSLPELDTEEFSTNRFADAGIKAPSAMSSQSSLTKSDINEALNASQSSAALNSPSVARRPLRVNLGIGRSMTTRPGIRNSNAKSIDTFMNIDSSGINVDVASWINSKDSLEESPSELPSKVVHSSRRGDALLVPSLVRAKTITQKPSKSASSLQEIPSETNLEAPPHKAPIPESPRVHLPEASEDAVALEEEQDLKLHGLRPVVNRNSKPGARPTGKEVHDEVPVAANKDITDNKPQDIVEKTRESAKKDSALPVPCDDTVSTARLIYDHTISPALSNIPMSMDALRVILIPLNAMFDFCVLDLSTSNRFGRNNTTNHPAFKAFTTLVVSRNHMDLFEKDGKVYIKDIGSNSGTFRNNARVSQPGVQSPDVEIHTGDYIQLGKDYTADGGEYDTYGRIQSKRRCVRFQVVIVPPGKEVNDVIKEQPVPIEEPLNKSDPYRPEVDPSTRRPPIPIMSMAPPPQPAVNRATKPDTHQRENTKFSLSNSASASALAVATNINNNSKVADGTAERLLDMAAPPPSIPLPGEEKTNAIAKEKALENHAPLNKSESDLSRSRSVFVKRSEKVEPEKSIMATMRETAEEAQKRFVSMREAMRRNGSDAEATQQLQRSNSTTLRDRFKNLMHVDVQRRDSENRPPHLNDKDKSSPLSPGSTNRMGLFEKRENFVLAIVTSGNKLKRLQVSNGQGGQTIDVQLKRWDERRIQIVDLRANGFGVLEIFDSQKTASKKGSIPLPSVTFSVTDASGALVGTLKFANALKLDVTPANADANSALITITGNFKEDRFILIRKAPNSREQRLFGECKGRHLVKKGVRDTNWLANLEIEQTELSPLIFSASILCCVASSSF